MKSYSNFDHCLRTEVRKKEWKQISFLWMLTLVIQLMPTTISRGCGPGDYSFSGYSFLLPDLIPTTTYAPFLMRFEELSGTYQQEDQIKINENLAEWKNIFCDLVSEKAIGTVIYTTSVQDLELLQTAVRSKTIPLDFRMSKNGFARHLESHKCTETVDYLIYAKRCEPHVSRQDSWSNAKRDKVAMQNLIAAGRRAFRKTKSNYIRLRYAYQIVRLAHYSGDAEQTIELHDELLPKIDKVVESILYDWMLGHRAGALLQLGERVEAAYLFSQIFQRCVSKRESAYQSFKIGSDEDWEACLLRCRSDQERATLYVLRAMEKDSQIPVEIENIYELDPKNENLEQLLIREIKKLEKDFLGDEFNDKKEDNKRLHQVPRKNAKTLLVSMQKIVHRCIEEKQVLNLQLWRLAEAYLEYLSGDLYAANRSFRILSKEITDPKLKQQLDIFNLAYQISNFEKIDEEQENQIVAIIKDNPYYQSQKDFRDFLNDKLFSAYQKDGHIGKSFRCRYDLRDLKPNPQENIIDDLLAICQKDTTTKFERALITYRGSGGETMETDLLDMKGNLLFNQGKLEAALETFKQVPRVAWDNYQFNPFIDEIVDCVHCEQTDTTTYYNKVEFLEKIFELEYQSKADYQNGAKYFYQLGTAFYNLTYFGHSWDVFDYFRGGSNWEYRKLGIFEHWFFPYGNREYQDCSKAKFYFEKSRELTKDPELAARATFMAAKCDQNAYFTSKDCTYYGGRKMPVLPPAYQKNYNLLKSDFSNTQFYQEVIQECKYFAAFARK